MYLYKYTDNNYLIIYRQTDLQNISMAYRAFQFNLRRIKEKTKLDANHSTIGGTFLSLIVTLCYKCRVYENSIARYAFYF